jgi:hypothetical protein
MATSNGNIKGKLDNQPAGFLGAMHTSKELYACSREGDKQGRFDNNVNK